MEWTVSKISLELRRDRRTIDKAINAGDVKPIRTKGRAKYYRLADVVSSWKKFTARKINREIHGEDSVKNPPLWQRDYWDRFIRDKKHFEFAVDYILNNAVKAGLAATPEAWRWCSASYQE